LRYRRRLALDALFRPLPRRTQPFEPRLGVRFGSSQVHQKIVVQTNDITGLAPGFRRPFLPADGEGLDVGVQKQVAAARARACAAWRCALVTRTCTGSRRTRSAPYSLTSSARCSARALRLRT